MPTASAASQSCDVVVIGGGLAGLAGALELQQAGLDVRVLEARDRVGGRVERFIGNGAVLDLGASWITPDQTEILGLIKRFGLSTLAMYEDGATVLVAGDEAHKVDAATSAYGSPEVTAAIEAFDALAATVPLEEPWRAPAASQLDRTSLGAWLAQEVKSVDARQLLTIGAEGYFAVSVDEVPLLHALFYARSNGGCDHLVGDSGDPIRQLRVAEGSGSVAEKLAVELGTAVQLDERACAVTTTTDVSVETPHRRVTARRALIAMAPQLSGRIHFEPALPWTRDQLIQRWSLGGGWKSHLVYPEAFWRREGLCGRVIDIDRDLAAFDTSPASGKPGVLTAFLPLSRTHELDEAGPEARRDLLLASLTAAFGQPAVSPLDYVDRNWFAEGFSRGDVSVPGFGMWTRYGRWLREPSGLIHWAGTETATIFAGQMEGAVRSGRRAAAEILAALS